ncbi:CmpA/NrtA family ABC transporter substrate-binding protein [Chitinimonas sp.]|uniref:CmpA/NrtA family ABC transporter substrate-binding protein n=1 Tax=Chitinimonas sp. TaxID=1934313 RepID=UPI002F937A71
MPNTPSPSAYLAGSDAPEKTKLRLGFVPLNDCAPLIAAKLLELGRPYGLELELLRQPSWAAVRDKLLSGELDAAQALYGLVYGVQLGLGGPQADMAVLMTLNRNGQAITVSNRLAQALGHGESLATSLSARDEPATFAQTFPTGTHAMWLYYWLAAQGVHPLRDVRSVVIPPPQMAAALQRGELDGYCAGEPWHAVAEAMHAGRTVASSSEIWPDHPEKVLACRADFAALYPNTARALTATLLAACRWLEESSHRRQAATWLASPDYLDLPEALIASRLLGDYGSAPLRQAPLPVRFHAEGEVNYPYLSDGLWFLSQYRRWGMLPGETDLKAITSAVNQTARYAEAASLLGINLPASTSRRSVLMDGQVWDGSDPLGYAASFPLHA